MKFLNRVGSQSPRAGPNAACGVKVTMKPIPCRELNLPIGRVENRVSQPARCLCRREESATSEGRPSQDWNGKATGDYCFNPSLSNPVAHRGLQT
jgi:hypothetical protein